MNIRSLPLLGLIVLLSVASLSATDPPPCASLSERALCGADETLGPRLGSAAETTSITLEDYWNLVSDTRRAIAEMKAKPQATIRQELNALAEQWEQVTAVELPDRSVMPIDSSYLTAELRKDPIELERLGNLLEALLHAHAEYPQEFFAVEDIAPLDRILARPEFQWEQRQAVQAPNWLSTLYQRFVNFINRMLFRTGTLVYERRVLFEVIAVFLFILAVFFISRGLSRSLVREAQVGGDGSESDELLTSQGAFKRAEVLSLQGDYRNAIRFLYLSSLLVLDEQGLMRYDRSRTNREYLRSVSSKPELAKPLRAVVEVFDRVWYGFESVDEQTYQSYVERVDELREKKE